MQIDQTFEKAKDQFTALNSKAVEFAEENTKAAFAFTREALNAKTPEALWSVQQAYMKAQQDAMTKQFEAVTTLYSTWFKDMSAPMADAMKPFMPKAA
jgi:hypothetical protein